MSKPLTTAQKFLLRQKISDYAKSLGFDLVGFSPAKIQEKYLKAFEDWLKNGNHADMSYMEKIEQRRDMEKVLPGAKSVIVLAMNYYHEQKPVSRSHGRIARYAYGRDYHKVIGKKLKELEKFIAELIHAPSTENSHGSHFTFPTNKNPEKSARADFLGENIPLTKSYVDTGPIMERALAEQAGLGRIGKNGCLITKEFGSWVFLSEIITTLDLNFEKVSPVTLGTSGPNSPSKVRTASSTDNHASTISTSPSPDRWSTPSAPSFNVCGNCRRCVTACPTGAIIAPGIVDSRLCISYLTIENKKKIPPKLAKLIKKTQRLFGCDICQEVCPHNNARQKINTHSELSTPKIAADEVSIKEISQIKSDQQFLQTFAGSPLMRAKRKGLTRNAKVIL